MDSTDLQLYDDVDGDTFLGPHQGIMICTIVLLDELNPNLRGIVMAILAKCCKVFFFSSSPTTDIPSRKKCHSTTNSVDH